MGQADVRGSSRVQRGSANGNRARNVTAGSRANPSGSNSPRLPSAFQLVVTERYVPYPDGHLAPAGLSDMRGLGSTIGEGTRTDDGDERVQTRITSPSSNPTPTSASELGEHVLPRAAIGAGRFGHLDGNLPQPSRGR